MNRTATYPSSLLAHCCKALGVSAFGAATTPPINRSFAMLCARFLWQEKVRCVVSAGHLTRRTLCCPYTNDMDAYLTRNLLSLTQKAQNYTETRLLRSCLPSGRRDKLKRTVLHSPALSRTFLNCSSLRGTVQDLTKSRV